MWCQGRKMTICAFSNTLRAKARSLIAGFCQQGQQPQACHCARQAQVGIRVCHTRARIRRAWLVCRRMTTSRKCEGQQPECLAGSRGRTWRSCSVTHQSQGCAELRLTSTKPRAPSQALHPRAWRAGAAAPAAAGAGAAGAAGAPQQGKRAACMHLHLLQRWQAEHAARSLVQHGAPSAASWPC